MTMLTTEDEFLEAIDNGQLIDFDDLRYCTKSKVWNTLLPLQKIPSGFLQSYSRRYDHDLAVKYQEFDSDTLNEMRYKLDMHLVSQYQTLTEEQISKYFDWLNMSLISKHQVLSEKFVIRYFRYLDWRMLGRYQHFSIAFLKTNLSWFTPEDLQNNFSYYSTDEKKALVQGLGIFKCGEDSFTACMKTTRDFCNAKHLKEKYELGQYYSTNPDWFKEYDGFDFAIGTEGEMHSLAGADCYVRVEVPYAAVTFVGPKNRPVVRCYVFKVLEKINTKDSHCVDSSALNSLFSNTVKSHSVGSAGSTESAGVPRLAPTVAGSGSDSGSGSDPGSADLSQAEHSPLAQMNSFDSAPSSKISKPNEDAVKALDALGLI